MMRARTLWVPACVLVLTYGVWAAEAGDLIELARGGRSDYRVVIAAGAEEPTPAAAKDFVQFFKEITGAELAIVTDDEARGEREILIGPSAHVDELMLGVDLSRLEDEEYLITTVDSSLILTGGKTRGVPNAVYTFLDEILGCRWYTPDVTIVPRNPTLAVRRLYRRRKPAFKRRMISLANAARPAWSARVRLNHFSPSVRWANHGQTTTWGDFLGDRRLAGSWIAAAKDWRTHVHALRLGGLLTKQDADEHPEYFALVNGKRDPAAQICYSQPGLVSVVAARAKEWIRKNPNATHVSISPADAHTLCQCDACTERAGAFTYAVHRLADGTPTRPDFEMTNHARTGMLMDFVNAVAREIAKDHPQILVHTFSYNETLCPPNETVMEPNVIVEYANLYACTYHTFSTCAYNEGLHCFWSNLQRWGDKAKHVWIWWYDIYQPVFHPVAIFPHWRDNLLEWRDVGVEGVYVQTHQHGGYLDQQWLQHLRAYVYAKTLWDPTRDVWEVIDEFARAFYGGAAEPMLAYIRETQEPASYKKSTNPHTGKRPGFHVPAGAPNYVEPDAVRRWEQLLDEAEDRAAGNETVLDRIAVDRLSVDFAAMLYLTPDDPVRRRATTRFFETAPDLGSGTRHVKVDGKIRTLDEAAETLSKSPAKTLEGK